MPRRRPLQEVGNAAVSVNTAAIEAARTLRMIRHLLEKMEEGKIHLVPEVDGAEAGAAIQAIIQRTPGKVKMALSVALEVDD